MSKPTIDYDANRARWLEAAEALAADFQNDSIDVVRLAVMQYAFIATGGAEDALRASAIQTGATIEAGLGKVLLRYRDGPERRHCAAFALSLLGSILMERERSEGGGV